MDNVTLNAHNYQLPTKTLEIVERIEALTLTETQYEKRQIRAAECLTAEYNFVVDILGEENANEVLGASNLNEVDINNVSISVIKILGAYSDRVEKARLEKQMQIYNDPKVKQAIELIKSANKFNPPGK